MRALVTGAAGFVGGHAVRVLRAHGWETTGLDVAGSGWPSRFPEGAVDAVVSLAATADPREALADPAGAYANGTGIMVETMEYARRTGARVVHVSTNEAHPPTGPYGGAKACQEVVCSAYPDVPTAIIVTQSLFGEGQQTDKLVPTVVRCLLAGETVRLQRDETAWAARPFLYVGNLAEALAHVAATGQTGLSRAGATEVLTVRDVVMILEEALGRRARIEAVPAGDRPGHEAHVQPIGWDVPGIEPLHPAAGSLQRVARWYADLAVPA